MCVKASQILHLKHKLIICQVKIELLKGKHEDPHYMEDYALRNVCGASLVVQWLRSCPARQGTQVQSLVWEDAVGQVSPSATTSEPVLRSL